MKNNQLSNRVAPTIAFRVEDFLVEYKEETLWDKVANFFVGKEKRAELNPHVLGAMSHIFRHTDMCCDLVIDESEYNEEVQKLLADIPYNRLIQITKPVTIAIMLNTGDITYYVDNDIERINIVGNKNCLRLEQLEPYIRVGRDFA